MFVALQTVVLFTCLIENVLSVSCLLGIVISQRMNIRYAYCVLADVWSVDGWGLIPQARSVMGRGWGVLQSKERCRLTTCVQRHGMACAGLMSPLTRRTNL